MIPPELTEILKEIFSNKWLVTILVLTIITILMATI